ncbi:MAG: hypothetical protein FWF00_02850 [Endomicrobia bacterium]|nr:hypothetical protein [Endomicrobiia bacterium]MCL2506613.1 hypothetical protein [Endomicrobiia bacterium]
MNKFFAVAGIVMLGMSFLIAGCSNDKEKRKILGDFTPNVYDMTIYPADGTSFNAGTTFKIYAVTTINGVESDNESLGSFQLARSTAPAAAYTMGGVLQYSGESKGVNLTINGSSESGGWVSVTIGWVSKNVSKTAKYYVN